MSTEETGLEIKPGKTMVTPDAAQPTTEEVATSEEVRTEQQPETDNEGVSEKTPSAESSQKARELGVTNRSMAESLIEMARLSDANRTAVKARLESDTVLKRYFEKKFPEALAVINNDKVVSRKTEEEVRVELKAEMLKRSIEAEKQVTWEDFSSKLSFTGAEAEELKALANKLEGTVLRGKEVTWKDAMNMAALTVNATKAKAGKVVLPTGSIPESPKPAKKSIVSDDIIEMQAKTMGRKTDEVKASFQEIEKNMKDNIFTLSI